MTTAKRLLPLLLSSLWFPLLTSEAKAQLIPDRTLGSESSIVTSGDRTQIDGGAQRGSTLFHSFQEFNVDQGQQVYFSNPQGVARIFSRVTGDNPSAILGTLGVSGNADLFLLNPHGILFGPNARLDINGSFLATTGDRFLFNNYSFSASDPTAPPLLTINTPVGLQVGTRPGPIQVQTRNLGLSAAPGHTLALVGGDVTLTSGNLTTFSGRVDIGSLRNGDVDIIPEAGTFRLGYETPLSAGRTVTLTNQARIASVNLGPATGGAIAVRAGQLIFSNGGLISSTTLSSGTGGPIRVNANAIAISGTNAANPNLPSGIQTNSLSSGAGGSVILNTARLVMRSGGGITSFNNSTGPGGNIRILASGSISGTSVSPLNPANGNNIASQTTGSGPGGSISVTTPRLTLQGGSRIQSTAWADGRGGDIRVNAAESINASETNPVVVVYPSGITSVTFGSGDSGDTTVTTNHLTLEKGATITSAVIANRDQVIEVSGFIPELAPLYGQPGAGTGSAGRVNVTANTILLDGISRSAPDSPSKIGSLTLGTGSAGDVDVQARELRLQNGALLLSSTVPSIPSFSEALPGSGTGAGGDVTVNADRIVVTGFNLRARIGLGSTLGTQTLGPGSSGQTTIHTNDLIVRNGGSVSSGTFTSGAGGRLEIRASNSIQVAGSHRYRSNPSRGASNSNNPTVLFSSIGTFAGGANSNLRSTYSLPDEASGNAGSLLIATDRLRIANGGAVSVQHFDAGDAGQMQINAQSIILDRGNLSASTGSGRGGNINLQVADALLIRHFSQITTNANSGRGDGGNITTDAGFVVAVPEENSDLTAGAFGGRGGQINITTQGLFGLERRDVRTGLSDITAQSRIGINGTVLITTPDVDPSQSVVELPETPVDESDRIVAGCPSDSEATFIITGRGGLPADPTEVMNQALVWTDNRGDASAQSAPVDPNSTPANSSSSPSIVEAQNWRVNERGQVELVTASPEAPGLNGDRLSSCSWANHSSH